MQSLPILDIGQFNTLSRGEHFYANIFSKHLREHHTRINSPHKHNFYLTVLFTHGTGTHEVDFRQYEVKPGTLFLLSPGQMHNWTLSDDIEGYVFFHTTEFYELLFPNRSIKEFPMYFSLQNSRCVSVPSGDVEVISQCFAQLVKEFQFDRLMSLRKIGALLELIYIDVSRLYVRSYGEFEGEFPKGKEWIRRLDYLIEKNYQREKRPSFYADRLSISQKHLNRIVQQSIGKTTSEMISERIVLEAKRLLVQKDISVQQVSFELGFEDASYFSRFFKKHCGYTPKEFHLSYQQEGNKS